MFRRTFLAALAALAVSASPAHAQPPVTPDEMAKIPRLSLKDYKPLQAKNAVLTVDVRDQHAFDEGHIPGAMNVSIVDIEIMANKVLKDKRPVVAYCACPDEHSSLVVAAKLARVGVKDIKVLVGGWNAWKSSGGKVELTPPQ
ncbi:MAG: rhodanese-like domain-containing protein [Vicinamibacterales bacterium]